MDVWTLIKEGRYADAINQADLEVAAGGTSLLPRRNKVFALLKLGLLDEAAAVCEELISVSNGDTDSDFIFLGVAQWLAGRKTNATASWEKARNTTYTDAAGGIEAPLLLWYAGVREGDEELKKRNAKLIRRLGTTARAKSWPGPLSKIVSDQVDLSALAPHMSSQESVRARQTCQAAFYLGVSKLEQGDAGGALMWMKHATEQGAISMLRPEYYLAEYELRQIA